MRGDAILSVRPFFAGDPDYQKPALTPGGQCGACLSGHGSQCSHGGHGYEAIGDQSAKVQRDLRSVFVGGRDGAAKLSRPVRLTRFTERSKQFTRRGDANRVVANCFRELLG